MVDDSVMRIVLLVDAMLNPGFCWDGDGGQPEIVYEGGDAHIFPRCQPCLLVHLHVRPSARLLLLSI